MVEVMLTASCSVDPLHTVQATALLAYSTVMYVTLPLS